MGLGYYKGLRGLGFRGLELIKVYRGFEGRTWRIEEHNLDSGSRVHGAELRM